MTQSRLSPHSLSAQVALAGALESAHQHNQTINTETGTYEAVLACLQTVMTVGLTLRRARALLLLAGDPALSMKRLALECQCSEKAAMRVVAILFGKGLILTPHDGRTLLTTQGQNVAASIVACTALGEAAFHLRQMKPHVAAAAVRKVAEA